MKPYLLIASSLTAIAIAVSGCASKGGKLRKVDYSELKGEAPILSLILANVDAAVAELVTLPASAPRDAALLNLRVARSALPGPALPADIEAAAKIGKAVHAGDAAKAEDLTAKGESAAAALLAAKDKEIADAAKAIADERARHKQEVADLKASWSKNLQLWTARGFVSVGSLVVAISISAIFWAGLAAKKHIILGVAAGMACIGVGFAIGEPWVLWLGRVAIGLLVVAGTGWGFYVVRTAIIERRSRLAIQDAKDEAKATGKTDAWDWLKEHLAYRMPRAKDGAKSAIEKDIDARLAAEGVNTPAA